ncbi:hypothetical protein EON64_20210, partial [archaeon]
MIEQPLMQNVLADLCVESEAHSMLSMYAASLYDMYYNQKGSERGRELFRVSVAVSKYYVTKRLPPFTYECLEALGGNGFVEDFPLARMFRHSPLNAVWEGSGNVIALDIVVRASQHLGLLLEELHTYKGKDSRLDGLLGYLDTLVAQRVKGGTEGGDLLEQQRWEQPPWLLCAKLCPSST